MSELEPIEVSALPTLVVVSGPPGAGKTTLARRLAGLLPCPAICRDEIKEGMVHATPGFVAGAPGDELTKRTFPVFFSVLRVLLDGGVTVVAEAAFGDGAWRAGLDPLSGLASFRVVRCHAGHETRLARRQSRGVRRAHADAHTLSAAAAEHDAFDWLSLEVPAMDVETTSDYDPPLEVVLAFISDPEHS